MTPLDHERQREELTLKVLRELLAAAKAQVDILTLRREGLPEAEDFMHALTTGAPHPLLLKWEGLKGTVAANRPPPDLLEQAARRGAVIMCKALHRAGVNKRGARKMAAKMLQEVFPVTTEQIRYWQNNYSPAPDDEKWIAAAIRRHGNDHRKIAGWFAAVIRWGFDPAYGSKVAVIPPDLSATNLCEDHSGAAKEPSRGS